MLITADFMFRSGAGFDQLVERLGSNPKFIFHVTRTSQADKRTKRAKVRGWLELKHGGRGMEGSIRLIKDRGWCYCEITDEALGRLAGAWVSWIARNAADLVCGMDIRIE